MLRDTSDGGGTAVMRSFVVTSLKISKTIEILTTSLLLATTQDDQPTTITLLWKPYHGRRQLGWPVVKSDERKTVKHNRELWRMMKTDCAQLMTMMITMAVF